MNTSFEWDEAKNSENLLKHRVDFITAQYAFIDPNRVIAEDLEHSKDEKRYMKKQIKYTNEPIEAKVINDFLPSPEELSLNEKKTKITLTLTAKSVDFFKENAKKQGASYQGMIRRLIDYYVANQK